MATSQGEGSTGGGNRVHIAALLHERKARVRLQAAVGREHWVAFVSSWGEFDRCVRALPVALAVVDPRSQGRLEVEAVERLAVRHPSISILLYLPFGPEVAEPLLRWARRGVHHVVFLDLGDTSFFLRDIVHRALARCFAEALADEVTGALAPLSAPADEAIRVAIRRLTEIRTGSDWAAGLGVCASSLYRLLRASALPPPRRALDWLRLLYVAKMLDDPGYSLEDVRRRLRDNVTPGFWRRVPELADAPLSELRYTMPFARLVNRFALEARPASGGRRAAVGAQESTG